MIKDMSYYVNIMNLQRDTQIALSLTDDQRPTSHHFGCAIAGSILNWTFQKAAHRVLQKLKLRLWNDKGIHAPDLMALNDLLIWSYV